MLPETCRENKHTKKNIKQSWLYLQNNNLHVPIFVHSLYTITNNSYIGTLLYVSTINSSLHEYFPIQYKLIGFYDRDEKCLQRGTDWFSKYSSLRFVFEGFKLC